MMSIDKQAILSQLIVIRWKRGDPSAFTDLVKHWERPLIYYIRRMLGEGQDEWDVLQEIWLRVFHGLGALREPKCLSVWLYRIAHHTVMRQLREKYAEPPIDHAADPDVVDRAELESAEFDGEDALALNQSLAQLPLMFREILTLRFLEGMSVQNVSEVLNVPEGTVKSRLYHAKRALKEIYERKESR